MAYSNLVALSHADWSLFLLIVALRRRRRNILDFVTTHYKKNSLLLSFSSRTDSIEMPSVCCARLDAMLLWKLKFYNGVPVSHLAPGRLFRSVGFNFLQLSGLGVNKITKLES